MSKIQKRKVSIKPIFRDLKIRNESVDVESRTAELVFSTGARVRRFSWARGEYIEELSLKKSDVRLDRLNNGAPLLNNHSQRDLSDVIGVVESASVDGKVGTAKVRFSSREDVEPIFKDVKDNIIRNISVGYRIHRMMELPELDEDTGLPVFRAVDWEPIEVSAVTAPADDGAKFRSEEKASEGLEENTCEISEIERKIEGEEPPQKENRGNDPENKTGVETQPDVRQDQTNSMGENTMTEEEKRALQEEATKAERKRQSDIKDAVRKAGLEDSYAEELCSSEISVDDARTAIIEKISEKQTEETPTRTVNTDVEVGVEHVDKVKRGVELAIEHRAFSSVGVKSELKDEAKEFRGMRLLDLAREVLQAQGINTRGYYPGQLADIALNNKVTGIRGGMHTTSDFPELLANVINKSLRKAYDTSPKTWGSFTNETTNPDFKEVSRTQFGEGEKLEQVPEGGEIRKGTISEGAEKYSLGTYGKIYSISRQMIVNDDMRALARLPQIMGRRAADLDADIVWGIITGNPNMSDGNPLFDAAHGNLAGAGSVISDTSLSDFRKALRKQLGLDGQKLGLIPSFIAVPTDIETVAEKELATRQPDSSNNVGAFSAEGRTPLGLIVEPRLDDDSTISWYGFGDKNQIDIVELARLEGEDGPMIQSKDGFEIEGMQVKIRYDVVAKAIDWRGVYKNPGA